MKLLLALLLLLPALSNAVVFRPVLDGSDQARFEKYMEAVRESESIVNTQEFRSRVLAKKTFNSTTLTADQVLKKIDEAEEILVPGKDGVGYWKTGFYFKRGTRVVGWTNQKILTVWVNKAKFDKMMVWDISDNVVHEWLHKIGFDHSSASDHDSVPYWIGHLVRDMIKEKMDIPTPIVTPRPSIWKRVKGFFNRIF